MRTKSPPVVILFLGWLHPQRAVLGGQCETLIVGVYGFARITSVAFRAANLPSTAPSKPVHPPNGGGGGNRTRIQNVSSLSELRPCTYYGGTDPEIQASCRVRVTMLILSASPKQEALKPIEQLHWATDNRIRAPFRNSWATPQIAPASGDCSHTCGT